MVALLIYFFTSPLFFTLVFLYIHEEDDEWSLFDFIILFIFSILWLPSIILMITYWLYFKVKKNAKNRNKKS